MSIVKALYGKSSSHHASAKDYHQQNAKLFSEYPSFAIVINPYTRLYSAYKYLNNNGMNVIDEVWKDKYLKKYKSFEHFVLSGLETAINENAQHFIPQFLFVTNSAGLIIIDHIGKLETLNETSAFLKSHDIDITFEHKNISNVNPIDIDNIYSSEMKTKVNELYARDFEYMML